MLTFTQIEHPDDPLIEEVRKMFAEYQKELGIDLCFQGFQEELAALPGRYAPPQGALLIANWNGEHAGCGALRGLGDGVCELKRIYVRSAYRGHKIGRSISEELIRLARERGYKTAKLDTLARLEPALALYRSLGFQEIAPYNFNPEPDIVYMELSLP